MDAQARADYEVQVRAMAQEAQGVLSLELVPSARESLPPFLAGAHIDLQLPNGLTRSYSLTNAQHETHRYVIGVRNEPQGRGGSRYIHETLRVGQTLRVGEPKNNFQLAEAGERHVFVAGGIGVTPFIAMLERLNVLKRPWTLHYCARTRAAAAFVGTIEQLAVAGRGRVEYYFRDQQRAPRLDIATALSQESPETHLYCCGPASMLESFKDACRERPRGQVHLEYFSSTVVQTGNSPFTVVLAKSGRRIPVPADSSVLDALLREGVDVPYACQEGVCGTCETRVLAGVPEHRDLILSPEEQASNASMMVCVSRCNSPELVLDL